MKILQVIPYFFLSWAGGRPVELIYNLSKSLLDRGHQITVYTTDAFNAKRRFGFRTELLNLEGIKVYEFRSLSGKLIGGHHIYFSPAMIPAMSREIGGFDVVHLHEYRTFQNILAHHYARKHGVPYVLQAHGSLPRIISKKGLKQTYDRLWGYRLLKDASRVIAVTGAEAEQYKGFGVSEPKIEVIPHGLDLSLFDNLPEKGEFRTKYGYSAQEKIILYLGRIHEIKGLDLLAKAFTDICKDVNDVKLVIVGPDDGYLPTLKKLVSALGINNRTLFTGPLYGREKLAAYVDADVYVLSSYYEIFSITVLEALACGTPVIVTDRCGLAEVVDGQAGIVVSPDKDKLSSALMSLLTESGQRQEFGERGKSLVREKFDWKIIAGRLEKVYQSI